MIAWLVVLPQVKLVTQVAAAGTYAGTTFPGSIRGAIPLAPLNASHWVKSMASNNSFKPNLLRSIKRVAQKACHPFASTTQVGLIQVLAAGEAIWQLQ